MAFDESEARERSKCADETARDDRAHELSCEDRGQGCDRDDTHRRYGEERSGEGRVAHVVPKMPRGQHAQGLTFSHQRWRRPTGARAWTGFGGGDGLLDESELGIRRLARLAHRAIR